MYTDTKMTKLTNIELQLLYALCVGTTTKQLAQDLGKSDFTVRNQLSSLYKKIGVAKRMYAVYWYQDYLRRNSTSVPLPERRLAVRMAAHVS
jgi:DNA-binding NarL/FixJ family response regulator